MSKKRKAIKEEARSKAVSMLSVLENHQGAITSDVLRKSMHLLRCWADLFMAQEGTNGDLLAFQLATEMNTKLSFFGYEPHSTKKALDIVNEMESSAVLTLFNPETMKGAMLKKGLKDGNE